MAPLQPELLKCEHCNDGDDGLRGDAIDAPNQQDARFNTGEPKGEAECAHRGDGREQRQAASHRAQKRVTDNANDGDRYAVEDSVGAMVDGAAIPLFVDLAGRSLGVVVLLEREAGDDGAGKREHHDGKGEEAHRWLWWHMAERRVTYDDGRV